MSAVLLPRTPSEGKLREVREVNLPQWEVGDERGRGGSDKISKAYVPVREVREVREVNSDLRV